MHVLSYEGQVVDSDQLALSNFQKYGPNDYHLVSRITEDISDTAFYVISPKDVVLARPRDINDHIEWLVQKQDYGTALNKAEHDESIKPQTIIEIGLKYISSLFEQGHFAEAAEITPKIFKDDSLLWESWIIKFIAKGQIRHLLPHVPVFEPKSEERHGPKISMESYDMILNDLLKTDLYLLLETVQKWPSTTYSLNNLINLMEPLFQVAQQNSLSVSVKKDGSGKDKESVKQDKILLELAVELYNRKKQYDSSFYYGLLLKKPDQIALVERHNLFSSLEKHCLLVMQYELEQLEKLEQIPKPSESIICDDAEWLELPNVTKRVRAMINTQGIQLLVNNTDRVLVKAVVQHLKANLLFLHVYLDALWLRDPHESEAFQDLQVELYAEFDANRLMNFLRISTFYSVPVAYNICEERDLVHEMMYLLGKLGNNRKALYLIIDRLNDVERAIEFAKEQNDAALWDEFLKFAMDKPAFIVGLLENLGNYIDPLRVIQSIPRNLEIPGLKSAIIKIMKDCRAQVNCFQQDVPN